jgi:ADP-heptose:LPS heptosyltransferase
MNEIWVLRPGALGDTILALPLIERLAQHYENEKIVFWGNTEYGGDNKRILSTS